MRRELNLIIAVCLLRIISSLTCYSCQFSFNDIYDAINQGDGFCANRTLLKMSSDEVIKPCSSVDNSCATIVTTVLGSFTSITRACAEHCSPICESVGYGQDQVSCTDCCTSNNCNKNSSIEYYKEVMARQYTSWEKPSNDEKLYNKKVKAKFPY